MTELHLRDLSASESVPRVKPHPKTSGIPVPFSYLPSDDGTDENLLILLHGLGDTNLPFAKLGRQLRLPQTAVLALRAPEQVPFLYESAFQWYTSFNELGEMIERPNPTPALELLNVVVRYLAKDCQWPVNRIHFFGFAQGGTVAVEFGVSRWQQQLLEQRSKSTQPSLSAPSPSTSSTSTSPPNASASLGSIVTISGPLVTHRSLSVSCSTPLLVLYQPPPSENAFPNGALSDLKKVYSHSTEVKKLAKEPGMPASKEGWQPVMEFWSKHLSRKNVDGLYEIMSGTASA